VSLERILVIQTAYIGDVVLTTPLVRELSRLAPEAEVHVVTTPLSAEIFRHCPYVAGTLPFDKRRRKLPDLAGLIRHCRRTGYDLSLSVQTSVTSALLALLGGVPERVGFDVQPFTTRSVPFRERGPEGRSRRILGLLKAVWPGAETTARTELFLSGREREAARRALARAARGTRLVGMAPGSVRATKRWPAGHWSRLLQALAEEGVTPVFVGGAAERDLCRRIIASSGTEGAVNLAGRLSLLESAAVIAETELMLSGDSAPMHMACAVGTPVFALFGPTVGEYGFFPTGEADRVFEVDLECRPCSLHGGRRCPLGHHRCMEEIDPGMLADAVAGFLERRGGK
jgi:heptosyltransferase-2